MVVAVVISLIVGGAIGMAIGIVVALTRRQRATIAPVDQTLTADVPISPHVDDPVGEVLRQAADLFERGVVICDTTGRVVYRNRAASAMSGTHVGVILDTHVTEMLAVALDGGRTEKRVDLHGPPRVSLEIAAEAMENGCAVATIEDISERSRIDAMRTDFVANISHELKTPVGAIAVLAEALEDEVDPEVMVRLSERIVGESHRAVTTIDDLLELSRIESAQLTDEVVDLHEIVRMAISRSSGVDDDKNVSVTSFDAHCDVLIRGDRPQLSSAIGNLVENAVKYSDVDGVVQVRTRVDDRFVEVMVADQGPGIPERDIDRIFERFYRVDRARSRATGGTGLGLSIVRHVATNHGGQVLVSSQEGDGSTFVLQLPASLLVDESVVDDETRRKPVTSETETSESPWPRTTSHRDRGATMEEPRT